MFLRKLGIRMVLINLIRSISILECGYERVRRQCRNALRRVWRISTRRDKRSLVYVCKRISIYTRSLNTIFLREVSSHAGEMTPEFRRSKSQPNKFLQTSNQADQQSSQRFLTKSDTCTSSHNFYLRAVWWHENCTPS
jgi:hypothetical protein